MRLSVAGLEGRRKEVLKAVGPTEVFHLADGRVKGTEHEGGGVDEGQFDTFGVLKKWKAEVDASKVSTRFRGSWVPYIPYEVLTHTLLSSSLGAAGEDD